MHTNSSSNRLSSLCLAGSLSWIFSLNAAFAQDSTPPPLEGNSSTLEAVSPGSSTEQGLTSATASAPVVEDGTKTSRASYQRAISLGRSGKFLEAREALEESLQDSPPLEAHFALGQIELALGHACVAKQAYMEYLDRGGDRISQERQKRVKGHIRQLEQGGGVSEQRCHPERLPGTLQLHCDRPDVKARLDEKMIEISPSLPHRLSPGSHSIEFFDSKGAWFPIQLQVEPGSATLVQCSPPPSARTQALLQEPPPKKWNTGQKVALGLGGASAGFLVATLSHFFWNKGRHDIWQTQDETLRSEGGSDEEYQSHNALADSIDKASGVTVGLAVASGALAAASLTVFTFSGKSGTSDKEGDSDRASISAAIAPGSASVAWSSQW